MFNIIKVIAILVDILNMGKTPTPGLCIYVTLIELLVINVMVVYWFMAAYRSYSCYNNLPKNRDWN